MPRRRSRARRVLGMTGAVVGTIVTFVIATVVTAVIHLNVPAARRLVAAQTSALLHHLLAGEVTIEQIGRLGLGGVDGVHVRVKDPEGVQVIDAGGLRARVRSLELVRSLVRGKGDIVIAVDTASISYADVALDSDAAGTPRIANAFAPRKSSPPAPPEPKDPNARGVRFDAPSMRIAHAWVHGQLAGVLPVDGELDALAARMHLDSGLVSVTLERADLAMRGLPRAVDPKGRLGGHLVLPSATGRDFGLDATFDGKIAGITSAAHVRMDGSRLDGVVDARDATGQGVRATFGELGIQQEVTVHSEAHGELPKLAVSAHVALGRGTADVTGDLDLRDGMKADAQLGVRHVDLRAIVPSAPVSDIGLDTRAHVVLSNGEVSVTGTLVTLPGTLSGETLPRLEARAELAGGVAHVAGHLVDPRGTADLEASLDAAGKDSIVEARVRASVPDLARLPEIGGKKLAGHALVSAEGTVSLGKRRLDARAHVTGGGVAYGAQTVEDITVLASAQGTMDHPVVDVGVHAGALASGSQKLEVAEVRARIEPGRVTTFRSVHVDLVNAGVTVGASAERVEIGGSRILVEGGVVTGLGEPIRADLSRDAQVVHLKVDAPAIDLRRVAVIAARPDALRAGRLSLNSDVELRRDSATGELHARVDALSNATIEEGVMTLDATFDGKSLGLGLKAEIGRAGRFELATRNVVVAGSPIELSSWTRAHGRAHFEGYVDLAKVASLFPEGVLPVRELGGMAVLAGVVRRDSGDVPPELAFHVHTRELVVAGKASGVPPWRTRGVDLGVDARIDATSGAGEVAVRAVDKLGTVAALDVKADLPYAESLADPSRARALLARAPISAKLVVPKRALSEMPHLMGIRNLAGTFEAELDVVGTALEPRVDFAGHARGVRSLLLSEKLASDVDLTFGYDGEKGELALTSSAEKRRVLDVTARLDLRSRELVEPAGEALAWTASAKAKLTSFPLQSIGLLADRHVRGRVSGEASIEGLHRDAKMHVRVGVDHVRIGRAAYESGTVVVDVSNGTALAKARLAQTDGYAEATVATDVAWGAALTPSLAPGASVDARLDAKAFRAAAVLPFVRTVFNELDGRIDANVAMKVGPGQQPAMSGKLVFHDGTVQLAALFGEELKDARATATFEPGGVIKVDEVFGRAADGELTASGSVRMRGLAFASASARVHIPDRKAIDLSLQGSPVGAATGDALVTVTASEEGGPLSVKVDVPAMKIELPQNLKSGVQDLEEKKDIRLGTFRGARSFVPLPMDKEDLAAPGEVVGEPPMIVDINLRLGDITITQGKQVTVVLSGNPHVRLAESTQVVGQIVVKQGKVDVQGKEFEIEKGILTFQPDDPANPIVVATAAWTAEDGTKIYADFTGPVKTGKVNLRSDPARPKNEILAIILFGTASGANAPPTPGRGTTDTTTKAATALGGGFAAQGLNEALDDLTGLPATARIDTTRSNNPAPQIEIQIARRLSLAFEHVLGTPPVSEPDTNFAIVDWRFHANWSLETTFGDRGKIRADAVWTKRY